MNLHVVILAGGVGSRLYPASTQANPKQFIEVNGQTLLSHTISRVQKLNPQSISIITNGDYYHKTVQVLSRHKYNNVDIISEPAQRGTFSAIMLATAEININHKNNDFILVIPSDLLINDIQGFVGTIIRMYNLLPDNAIGLIGIKPNSPNINYGYMKTKVPASTNSMTVVSNFVEKPDLETATEYLNQDYYWNSGMFMFRSQDLLNHVSTSSPAKNLMLEYTGDNYLSYEKYSELESLQFDKFTVQNHDNVQMIVANFDWSDLGTWDELQNRLMDEDLNVNIGENKLKNCKNFTAVSRSKKIIGINIENIAVVEGENCIFVVDKETSKLLNSLGVQ